MRQIIGDGFDCGRRLGRLAAATEAAEKGRCPADGDDGTRGTVLRSRGRQRLLMTRRADVKDGGRREVLWRKFRRREEEGRPSPCGCAVGKRNMKERENEFLTRQTSLLIFGNAHCPEILKDKPHFAFLPLFFPHQKRPNQTYALSKKGKPQVSLFDARRRLSPIRPHAPRPPCSASGSSKITTMRAVSCKVYPPR